MSRFFEYDATGWPYWSITQGYTINRSTYNPETHELRPKLSYIDHEITERDERIKALKSYYDEQIKQLEGEKAELIQQREKSRTG